MPLTFRTALRCQILTQTGDCLKNKSALMKQKNSISEIFRRDWRNHKSIQATQGYNEGQSDLLWMPQKQDEAFAESGNDRDGGKQKRFWHRKWVKSILFICYFPDDNYIRTSVPFSTSISTYLPCGKGILSDIIDTKEIVLCVVVNIKAKSFSCGKLLWCIGKG